MPSEDTNKLWEAIEAAIQVGALTLEEIILLINPPSSEESYNQEEVKH